MWIRVTLHIDIKRFCATSDKQVSDTPDIWNWLNKQVAPPQVSCHWLSWSRFVCPIQDAQINRFLLVSPGVQKLHTSPYIIHKLLQCAYIYFRRIDWVFSTTFFACHFLLLGLSALAFKIKPADCALHISNSLTLRHHSRRGGINLHTQREQHSAPVKDPFTQTFIKIPVDVSQRGVLRRSVEIDPSWAKSGIETWCRKYREYVAKGMVSKG